VTVDASWLLRDGNVLAAVEEPKRGWRSSLQGVVLLRRPTMVPTTRPLDVAWCTSSRHAPGPFRVRRIWKMPSYRVAPGPGFRRVLVVAPGGSFERWNLRVGDCLEIK
jgi:hypothetical protein